MSSRAVVMEGARSLRAGVRRTAARERVYPRRAGRRSLGGPARTSLAAALLLGSSGCQLNAFTVEQDRELGSDAYEEILKDLKVTTSGAAYQQAKRVTDRLVEAAHHFDPEIVEAFDWEVRVIQDDQVVNAFCLPGGKMAVYTGILPVTQGDEGLAVVMGHEIAHAIERHGTEAMTRIYGTAFLIEVLVGGDAKAVAEIGQALLHLQFGRSAELEADRRGLMYMARAGYDPREAVRFWTRMSELGGGEPIEWLSTHPSHGRRIDQIEELLPEAISIYEASQATGSSP